jgi:hypothetical protein
MVFGIGLLCISALTGVRLERAQLELQVQTNVMRQETLLYSQLDFILESRMDWVPRESHEECLNRGLEIANYHLLDRGFDYEDIRRQTMDWVEDNCGRLMYTPQIFTPFQTSPVMNYAGIRSRSYLLIEKAYSLLKERASSIWNRLFRSDHKKNDTGRLHADNLEHMLEDDGAGLGGGKPNVKGPYGDYQEQGLENGIDDFTHEEIIELLDRILTDKYQTPLGKMRRAHQVLYEDPRERTKMPFGFGLRCEPSKSCRLVEPQQVSMMANKTTILDEAINHFKRRVSRLSTIVDVLAHVRTTVNFGILPVLVMLQLLYLVLFAAHGGLDLVEALRSNAKTEKPKPFVEVLRTYTLSIESQRLIAVAALQLLGIDAHKQVAKTSGISELMMQWLCVCYLLGGNIGLLAFFLLKSRNGSPPLAHYLRKEIVAVSTDVRNTLKNALAARDGKTTPRKLDKQAQHGSNSNRTTWRLLLSRFPVSLATLSRNLRNHLNIRMQALAATLPDWSYLKAQCVELCTRVYEAHLREEAFLRNLRNDLSARMQALTANLPDWTFPQALWEDFWTRVREARLRGVAFCEEKLLTMLIARREERENGTGVENDRDGGVDSDTDFSIDSDDEDDVESAGTVTPPVSEDGSEWSVVAA